MALETQVQPKGPMQARPASAFKRILVQVDRDERSINRVKVAVELANRYGGKLTGAYVLQPIVPMAVAAGEIPASFLVEQEALAQQDADIAMRRYLDQVARMGMPSDWQYIRGFGVEKLRRLARYMDITIVGQVDPNMNETTVTVRPEEIALGSGRPVLIVPYIGAPAEIGSRVAIAWDGGREAARAVGDAMPILRQAHAVTVLSIDAEQGATDRSADPARDLCSFLADHEIAAEPQSLRTNGIDVPDLLLSRIADLGADLLVMGCYGHSRIRELVLGGATRGILQHMTVPVLMSH